MLLIMKNRVEKEGVRVSVRLDDETYDSVCHIIVDQRLSLQRYIEGLIRKDLGKKDRSDLPKRSYK